MLLRAKNIASACSCGGNHSIMTSRLECCDGATDMLIGFIKEKYAPQSALIVCDENTEKYTGPMIRSLCCKSFVLPGSAHANETETARLGNYIKSAGKPSVMIACGSGSVHDITRYCAHEIGVDFVSYPTAASVDGFVSGVAAMTMYGQKLTYPSSSPVALFAEPSVFCDAPQRLTASGVGDMIGKITALFDWQVSHILTDEALCPEIFSVMNDALGEILRAAGSKDSVDSKEFPVLVMNGLILSGLAMQLAGNSRPASGSEHHLSHFWEMHVANEPTDALHGEKVGVGTVLMLSHIKANDKLIGEDLSIDIGRTFEESVVSPVYKGLTKGILNENAPNGHSSSALAKLGRDSLKSNAKILKTLVDALPSPENAASVLAAVGAPVTLSDIALPSDTGFINTSLMFSPYVRNRLTFAKIISAARLTGGASCQ